MTTPPADRQIHAASFEVRRTTVRDNAEIAYIREGVGGLPLLMLHGWPSTKRIFYRNIGPLAEAGFEVIAPDASGWGDSPPRADRWTDQVMAGRDSVALMEALGHERFVLAAFDQGTIVGLDLVNRFPERILRQVLWSGVVPFMWDVYAAAGIGGDMIEEVVAATDHILEHGNHADRLCAGLDTAEARRDYVKGFYTTRVWKAGRPATGIAGPGAFDEDMASFHAEPFGDARMFRDSLRWYETPLHPETFSEPPLLAQASDVETLFLLGAHDFTTANANTARRIEVAYRNLVGPFFVDGAGHFLSWECPRLFNNAVISFCRDLLAR
ncbi:hypothetical protein M527_25675 [Sphingobium indicum IP26]|uniref:Epoxide hydrolase n=1 Tax=Sphingobium indicum F2 TaxID=1450518 RepID=A0A8E0WPC6_9SPHN|nr:MULTISPECIES: alpha/beta hydrolase [Sphingobium]EPR15205.1 hypothetical protein M527_25675 [Sphingobium indicum IP26]EQB03059.1 hypothetical protein L286_13645 [Sphingobium sp. HDIP04]KER34947.1 epoxide hydrolase [Sphingobium indicum F2]